ncbi:MAG: ABC transporter ATP-binding protein [Acidobacteria bacterium]|nr:ABC transporter ATP-binding protein [Acidobacteriota bacterium]
MELKPNSELLLSCRDLRKQYRGRGGIVHAVNGLDLEIRSGECFGLLGPNGAGKTTTIEIFEGLLPPTSGDVRVLGMHWGDNDNELRQKIGISLQETRFAERLTVLETITLFRSFYREGNRPEEVMETVGLNEKAGSWVVKLSGGQRQRLAVACALVGNPRLLFLDEPTTGLDPQSRRRLWDVIRRFQEENRAVLLTTHYMDEAERLCNRIAIIDHGKIIALGSPAELISGLGGEHIVEFSVGEGVDIPDYVLKGVPAVKEARTDGNGFALTVSEPHIAIPSLLESLQSRRLKLSRLTTRHASLEDVFVNLTGRHLRDGEVSSS